MHLQVFQWALRDFSWHKLAQSPLDFAHFANAHFIVNSRWTSEHFSIDEIRFFAGAKPESVSGNHCMTKSFNLTLLCILIFACTSKNNSNSSDLNTRENNSDSSIKTRYDSPQIIGNTKATFVGLFTGRPSKYYSNYDSSLGRMENFDRGYMQTFSISGVNFRVFSNPDSVSDLEVQVEKSGRWVTNFKIPFGSAGLEPFEDFNFDGHMDYLHCMLRGCGVYLFDFSKKQFYPDCIGLGLEYQVIDSTKHIYATEMSRDYWWTSVFVLNGFMATELYSAELEINDELNFKAELQVVKTNEATGKGTLLDKINVSIDTFEYQNFWKTYLHRNGYH